MMRRWNFQLAALLLLALLTATRTAQAEADPPSAPDQEPNPSASSQKAPEDEAAPPRPINLIHPLFEMRDEDGQAVGLSGKAPDTAKTCGACHDVEFIRRHDSHAAHRVIDCLTCHAPGGRLGGAPVAFDETGKIRREWMTIATPGPEECGACHGLTHAGEKPLALPDTLSAFSEGETPHPLHLTQETGTIFSGQKMRDSFLNLADKETHPHPWDIHAARLLTCSACHIAPNNPKRATPIKRGPAHLIQDPRRLSTAEYLARPDHRLLTKDCQSCHDPLKAHDFLPYRQRHFARLTCQACHVPQVKAPLLETEDFTVATPEGNPRLVWRNMPEDDQSNINTRYTKAFVPFLFPYQAGPDAPIQVTPANIVTRWEWTDAASGTVVLFETVRTAWEAEMSLHAADPEPKPQLLADEADVTRLTTRLRALGVKDPQITAESRFVPIRHGIQANETVIRDCATCHGQESRFGLGAKLGDRSIGGVTPQLRMADGARYGLAGGTVIARENSVWLHRNRAGADYYLLGHDRAPMIDTLGFLFFLLTALGVAGHAGRRIITRHLRRGTHRPVERVYLYTAYERLWHWLMAASILLLLLTGFEIHFMSSFGFFGFAHAVNVHNVLAAVMIVNAFLSLFYHLASTDIRQYIPRRETLMADILAQARFYLNGIFLGAPHPLRKSLHRKLNPLQQITYMGLLNVLIPLQVLTGLLIWGVGHSPVLSAAIGGLSVVTPLHTLGSWLLLSFVTAHLYLITTGHTLTSNLKAMVHGYDTVDALTDETHE